MDIQRESSKYDAAAGSEMETKIMIPWPLAYRTIIAANNVHCHFTLKASRCTRSLYSEGK